MQVLITNDDGIMSPGIQQLAAQARQLGDIYLSAPLSQKSAIGHGITIWDPIRIKEYSLPGIKKAWAVEGTPADCVKLAINHICPQPDLIISGINNGPNLGTDVLYSGTVSAAIEGAILGIPSMAVSLNSFQSDDYSVAAEITLLVVRYLENHSKLVSPDTLLNVNVPPVPKEELKGFRITRLGIREYENTFDQRTDPRGNMYFWLSGMPIPHGEEDPEIDMAAVEQNYVSITPLQFDLTNYRIWKDMKEWGLEDLHL